MKECNKCHKNKDESCYRFRKDTNGLNGLCMDCIAENKKKDYAKNKKSYIDRATKHKNKVRKSLRATLNEIKNIPCKDCGQIYPHYVMDFDHIDNKEFCINKLLSDGSGKKLFEEIKKCEVVCANCHRERTYQRKQYYK